MTGPLTLYVEALSSPFQLVEDWASDTDTDVGWSLFLDPDRCPVEGLPWLAQLVGLTLTTGLTSDEQRQQIKDLANWRRGTRLAMIGAASFFLTGNKTVIFRERYDGSPGDHPYHLEVATYTIETPDSSLVLRALLTQKPGGIILTYNVLDGQDFQTLKDNYATLQDVKDHYPTLEGVKSDTPV